MKPQRLKIEQVFKERVERATTFKQIEEALHTTIREFLKNHPYQQKELLDAFTNIVLLQVDGLSLKEQYILAFCQACAATWNKLEKAEEDKAVSHFANSMKERLDESRDRGKGGWWRDDTPIEVLYEGLLKAVTELRYVDIANYAMMLEYHKRAYGREVEKHSRLLDELDEAIAQHNNTVFAVRNPPLSLGIRAAREKILRRVQGLGHLVYNLADDAINNIIEEGLKRPNTRVSSGDLTWSRDFLRRLLNES